MSQKLNPFIGAKSYEEKDSFIFFGREQEVEELFQLVLINNFTLLYGRSGLGKTSVIQAGLFPKLREKDYIPVYIRPSYSNETSDFVKEVELSLFKNFDPGKLQVRGIEKGQTLWEYFHNAPLSDKATSKPVIPVLVFDQFEELFTLGTKDKSSELRENTRQLVAFLADLIENRPPLELDEEKRLDLQYAYGAKTIPVKILFSFREEYLSNFYSLSYMIPSIAYSNLQYRLSPLTFEKGYTIIKKASQGLFEEDAINQTLCVITESESVTAARKRDIDSFLLSIFCENQINTLGDNIDKIAAADIKNVNIQSLINNLYTSAVSELGLNENEKRLLEETLLTAEGHRLPVYLDIALGLPNTRKEKIEALEAKKILKRYFIDGKICIEIIHDKYAAAIKGERDFRKDGEMKQLQLLKDEEEFRKRKLEEAQRMEIEKAEMGRKKMEEELAYKEKMLSFERVQAVHQRNAKRRNMVIAVVAIGLAILSTFSFFDAQKQTVLATAKADTLNREKENVIKLNSRLQYNRDSLRSLQEILHLENVKLGQQKEVSDSLRIIADSKTQEATHKAMILSDTTASLMQERISLREERDRTRRLLESLETQLYKTTVARRIGQLLASARLLKNTDPAVAYQMAAAAVKLDPDDKKTLAFIDSLTDHSDYYEHVVTKGNYAIFSPDGRLFLNVTPENVVELFDINGKLLTKFPEESEVTSARFAADGKRILVVMEKGAALYNMQGNRLSAFDARDINFALFLPDNEKNIITVSDEAATVWRDDGKALRTFDKTGKILSATAGNNRLIINSIEGIKIYNIATGDLVSNLTVKRDNYTPSFSLIPNGKGYINYENKFIHIWNNEGKRVNSIKMDLGYDFNRSLLTVFTRDGSRGITIFSNSIKQQQQQQVNRSGKSFDQVFEVPVLFDLEREQAKVLDMDFDANNSIIFSPDGSQLSTFSYGGSLSIITLSDNSSKMLLDKNRFTMSDFSADNKYILTCTADNRTKLWTYGNAKELDAKGQLAKFSLTEIYRMAGISE